MTLPTSFSISQNNSFTFYKKFGRSRFRLCNNGVSFVFLQTIISREKILIINSMFVLVEIFLLFLPMSQDSPGTVTKTFDTFVLDINNSKWAPFFVFLFYFSFICSSQPFPTLTQSWSVKARAGGWLIDFLQP